VTIQLQLIKIIISLTEAEYVERMEGKSNPYQLQRELSGQEDTWNKQM
jgi:hypothetical protein